MPIVLLILLAFSVACDAAIPTFMSRQSPPPARTLTTSVSTNSDSTYTNGLIGWYIAGTGVYTDAGTTPAADGDRVYQWNDQSGLGRNLLQATTGNRPTNVLAFLNGQPAMRFAAALSKYMKLASFGVTDAQPITQIVVARVDGAGANRVLTDGGDATNRCSIQHDSTAHFLISSDGTELKGNAFVHTNWYVISALFNAASSVIETNGATYKTGTTGTDGMAGITIGANNAGSYLFEGYITEIRVYTNITDFYRASAVAYLRTKYGL